MLFFEEKDLVHVSWGFRMKLTLCFKPHSIVPEALVLGGTDVGEIIVSERLGLLDEHLVIPLRRCLQVLQYRR